MDRPRVQPSLWRWCTSGAWRMRVRQWSMRVGVGMGLARRIGNPVRMLVMSIMGMTVGVLGRLMHMGVLVTLGQVQPDAGSHQHARDGQPGGRRLSERDHGGERTEKRRGREVGAGARGPEIAQGEDEQDEARLRS